MDCWTCFTLALIAAAVIIYLGYDFIHNMGRSK